MIYSWNRDRYAFFVKSLIADILGFVESIVDFIVTTQFCSFGAKAAKGNMYING